MARIVTKTKIKPKLESVRLDFNAIQQNQLKQKNVFNTFKEKHTHKTKPKSNMTKKTTHLQQQEQKCNQKIFTTVISLIRFQIN